MRIHSSKGKRERNMGNKLITHSAVRPAVKMWYSVTNSVVGGGIIRAILYFIHASSHLYEIVPPSVYPSVPPLGMKGDLAAFCSIANASTWPSALVKGKKTK